MQWKTNSVVTQTQPGMWTFLPTPPLPMSFNEHSALKNGLIPNDEEKINFSFQ